MKVFCIWFYDGSTYINLELLFTTYDGAERWIMEHRGCQMWVTDDEEVIYVNPNGGPGEFYEIDTIEVYDS